MLCVEIMKTWKYEHGQEKANKTAGYTIPRVNPAFLLIVKMNFIAGHLYPKRSKIQTVK